MRSEILSAINDELAYSSRYVEFTVERRIRLGDLWAIVVDLSVDGSKGLDESFEGAIAWWPAEPKNGAADVLSILPESQQINLRYATTTPPDRGETIRLYPPRYLEALREVWTSIANANRSVGWLQTMRVRSEYKREHVPPLDAFSSVMRQKQAQAFDLLGMNAGFLWGPPGTGKTFTLGAMLAQHLVTFPRDRILLLSTTNSATDQALISVDKALESASGREPRAQTMRNRCKRLGQHFVASMYQDREHLLPIADDHLIKDLTRLESERPDKSNVQAYAIWKAQEEAIRAEIRRRAGQVLDSATLAAMTTTRAAFTFDQLLERSPFDLVIFDEASQVSIPHALAIAPLAKRVVFAGDPEQLAPIVQSKQPTTTKWLGRSMFAEMNPSSEATCFLDEQSRMSERICDLVSNCFYGGKLTVAKDAKSDPIWRMARQLPLVPELGDDAIVLDTVPADGTWSQKYRGPIRYESATRIKELVAILSHSTAENDILVLTPFRAQRTLIRTFLERAGYKRVRVSTVHRAQGSESRVVIFDPVDGNNNFLLTEDARRLVNVALSRAQARLIVLLSSGDRRNPLFEQIATVIEHRDDVNLTMSEETSFEQFQDFPFDAVGKVVRVNNRIGEVIEVIQCGAKFRFRDFATGEVKTFVTRAVQVKVVSTERTRHETKHEVLVGKQIAVRQRAEVSPKPSTARANAAARDKVVLAMMDSEMWFALSRWAKQNNALSDWDRRFCFSQAKRAKSGDLPSDKQAAICERIITEAIEQGFDITQRTDY